MNKYLKYPVVRDLRNDYLKKKELCQLLNYKNKEKEIDAYYQKARKAIEKIIDELEGKA